MKRRKKRLAVSGTGVLAAVFLIGLVGFSGCGLNEDPQGAIHPEASAPDKGGPTEREMAAAEAARNWLATNAIRLETVEAGHGFADMQPLKRIIGQARIVSLGEATHGTREFFQLKHRMLEFLVNEMQFNVFGIEATMPEAFDINEYVLTGQGDPVKALAGLYFWTWDTEEVLAMIEWMRRYNADPMHIRKVKFYGFDMQSAVRAAKVTLAFLRRLDSPQADRAEQDLGILANPYTESVFTRLAKDKKDAAAKAIKAVLSGFDRRKQDYLRRGGAEDWAIARQHAQVLSQYIELNSPDNLNPQIRDRAMADNIRWILNHEGPSAKAVIWAHNGHVATSEGGMGWYLRRIYGADMVVFGFAFNQGGFQAREGPFQTKGGLRSFEIGPAPQGSLDALLASADLRIAALDFRALPKSGAVADWFSAPQGTRDISAIYFDNSSRLAQRRVPSIYDGLLFVEKTTAAKPLSGRAPQLKLPAPSNLDFDEGETGKPPMGWQLPPNLSAYDFQVITSEETPHSGKRCAMISRSPGKHYGEVVASLTQRLDAKAYRGKKIKLQAATRGQITGPENHAWLRLVVTKRTPFLVDTRETVFDSLDQCPIDSPEWRVREIVVDVPPNAASISYGLFLMGDGKAWLDTVVLEVMGK
jgi:erythromycin esterase